MSPLTQYDTIAPNLEIMISVFDILILMYMPMCGTKMVLIDREMHEL